jgi:hypothetical protein
MYKHNTNCYLARGWNANDAYTRRVHNQSVYQLLSHVMVGTCNQDHIDDGPHHRQYHHQGHPITSSSHPHPTAHKFENDNDIQDNIQVQNHKVVPVQYILGVLLMLVKL